MSIPAGNVKNLLFSLRYPPDKILETLEGSFTANASSSTTSGERTHQVLSHNYGTTVFLDLSYSLDGGVTWQDQHVPVPDFSVPSVPVFDTLSVGCYSTTTEIVVVATSFKTSNQTVNYRINVISKD